MCNKAVNNYPHVLQIVFECYKTQKMCHKTIDTDPSTMKVVPECFITQEMCDEAINRFCLFVFLLD